MANSNLTADDITRKALKTLTNNLVFSKNVNRQYDDSFANRDYQIGDTLRIRLPHRFPLRTGRTLSATDVNEQKVDLQMATQIGVDINFTSKELALELGEFNEQIIEPALEPIVNKIDLDGLALYKEVFNLAGTAGTDPNTALIYLQAGQKLNESAAPRDNKRVVCINPGAEAATVNALTGLFHKSDSIAKQYARGRMGTAFGFEFGMDQNVNSHTCGAFAGTVLVNDTVASGDATIDMDAFTDSAPTLKEGDVFTIANVNKVNPQSGVSTGALQQFVVTADKTGSGNAIAGIAISPKMISGGAYQTIDALPANNAAVTFVGTASTAYAMNIAHHKDAFALVTADLPLPEDAHFAARRSNEGMSIRIWKASDIVNDKFPCRMDVLYGWKTIRPELACRIIGA